MSIGNPAHSAEVPRQRETFRMVPDRMTFDARLEPGDTRIWCCLLFLARYPSKNTLEATDAVIADKLKLSQQTLRRALQRLEKCQYIRRAMDGRTRIITLNPEGDGEPIAEFTLRVVAG